MILTPKNWHTFQHYKDRNPPWIKLHKSLLDDFDYQCLPDASKAIAPMLWLLASESMDGSIQMTEEAFVFRLRKPFQELLNAIEPLVSKGFFTCDSTMLASCKHDAPLEEERRGEDIKQEKKREDSPIPPTKGRKSKEDKIKAFPPEVQEVCLALHREWPMEGTDGDKTSPTDPSLFSQRISNLLDSKIPADVLLEAGRDYIKAPRKRYKAPQFFFGEKDFGGGEAPWIGAVRLVMTRRERANTPA